MTYVVKHLGDPKQAKTLKGRRVTRQESLFVPEMGAMVKCAPYDDHFVYHDPNNNGSAYLCTCGSPAVIAPPDPSGMFMCLFHATYGKHQTSYINTKDFADVAGQTIEIAGKHKRLK